MFTFLVVLCNKCIVVGLNKCINVILMDYSENFDQVYFQKKLNICSLVNSNFNGEETRVNCSMAFKQK